MVVAIDGPAGTGKSTIAKEAARNTSLYYVNSGNLYRAVTHLCMTQGIDTNESSAVLNCLQQHEIDFLQGKTLIDGQGVDEMLRSDKVDAKVAQVSSIEEVRNVVNSILRKISSHTDIIVEGRDMTTVVFPDAEIKIFLDADAKERAKRRFDQGTSSLTLEEIEKSIEIRDNIDRNKKIGALKQAPDAEYLDTSHLTIEEVCVRVLELIQRHI